MTSIKWREREVKNPVLRILTAAAIIAIVPTFLIVMIPVTLPLHVLLLLCGRRGFVTWNKDGSLSYEVGWFGFRREIEP